MSVRLQRLREKVHLIVHPTQYSSNTYLIEGDRGEILIIDPGLPDIFPDVLSFLRSRSTIFIIHTHFHYDHIAATPVFKNALTNIKVLHHVKGVEALRNADAELTLSTLFGDIMQPLEVDLPIDEGVLELESLKLEVLHTPGHTEDSICIVFGDVVFTGDLIFSDGNIGRTDLPTGSEYALYLSLEKISNLGRKIIAPGHGRPGVFDFRRVKELTML
ncbi:MAG: hypothetical protein DRJ38_06785 [Thermoprotei archaeon]|nr:MAG: hypothetical protein DRJ38_06785 [Thermoprotei archaeon]